MKPQIFSIVVAFEPGEGFSSLVRNLAKQVDCVIVYKNSRVSNETFPENVIHIGQESNIGLGCALNRGIDFGLKQGAKWFLFFDQDSEPKENFVEEAFSTINEIALKTGNQEFIFGARFSEFGVTESFEGLSGFDVVASVFTSGTIIPASVMEKIGLMNEGFFIDQIDHEFCLRAQRFGVPVYRGKKVLFKHRVGNPVQRKFLFWTLHPTWQNPQRWFFGARNLVWTLKLNGPRPVKFFIFEVYSQFSRLAKVWFFEEDKWPKTLAFLNGIFTGLMEKAPKAPMVKDDIYR